MDTLAKLLKVELIIDIIMGSCSAVGFILLQDEQGQYNINRTLQQLGGNILRVCEHFWSTIIAGIVRSLHGIHFEVTHKQFIQQIYCFPNL